jgi:hypothetical protein
MRRPIEMKPLGNMNNVVRAKRVGSSTAPAKQVNSSSSSYSEEDAAGWYAANGEVQLSGQDKHMLTMLDAYDQATADTFLDSYYS